MATKVQIVLEEQRKAAGEITKVTREVQLLEQTAAGANRQTELLGASIGNRLPKAGLAAAGGVAKFNQSLAASRQGMQAVRQLGTVLGFQMFPQLTGAVLAGTSALSGLRLGALAAGVSLGALTGGVAALVAAIALAMPVIRAYRKELDTTADNKRLEENNRKRLKDVRERISLMERERKLTASQASDFRWMIEQAFFNTTSPSLAGQNDLLTFLEAQLGVSQIAKLGQAEAQKSVTELQKLTRDLELSNLRGSEKMREEARRTYDERMAFIGLERTAIEENSQGLTPDEQMAARRAVWAAAKAALTEYNLALAEADEAVNKLMASERAIQEKAVADRMSQAASGQRQLAQLIGGIQDQRLGRVIGDPNANPNQIAAAERALAENQYAAELARLDDIVASDEEHWMAREELARAFSERLLEIERSREQAERQLRIQKLAAVQGIFGDLAHAARQFGSEGFVAYKALAVGEAIVATYLAATRALAELPTGFNYAAAAAVTAAGMGNVAAIIAQQPPGYARGGYTGPGGKYEPAGIVHRDEFVFPKEAVQRYGVAQLNRMAFSKPAPLLPGYAAGGLVSAAPAASNVHVDIREFRDRQDLRDWQARRNRQALVKDLRKNGFR